MISLDRNVPLWELKAMLDNRVANATDPAIRSREARLARVMTENDHPYFAYLVQVPDDEKRIYLSLDDHPDGGGIAFRHWILSGAFERCARDNNEPDEKIREVRSEVPVMTTEEVLTCVTCH